MADGLQVATDRPLRHGFLYEKSPGLLGVGCRWNKCQYAVFEGAVIDTTTQDAQFKFLRRLDKHVSDVRRSSNFSQEWIAVRAFADNHLNVAKDRLAICVKITSSDEIQTAKKYFQSVPTKDLILFCKSVEDRAEWISACNSKLRPKSTSASGQDNNVSMTAAREPVVVVKSDERRSEQLNSLLEEGFQNASLGTAAAKEGDWPAAEKYFSLGSALLEKVATCMSDVTKFSQILEESRFYKKMAETAKENSARDKADSDITTHGNEAERNTKKVHSELCATDTECLQSSLPDLPELAVSEVVGNEPVTDGFGQDSSFGPQKSLFTETDAGESSGSSAAESRRPKNRTMNREAENKNDNDEEEQLLRRLKALQSRSDAPPLSSSVYGNSYRHSSGSTEGDLSERLRALKNFPDKEVDEEDLNRRWNKLEQERIEQETQAGNGAEEHGGSMEINDTDEFLLDWFESTSTSVSAKDYGIATSHIDAQLPKSVYSSSAEGTRTVKLGRAVDRANAQIEEHLRNLGQMHLFKEQLCDEAKLSLGHSNVAGRSLESRSASDLLAESMDQVRLEEKYGKNGSQSKTQRDCEHPGKPTSPSENATVAINEEDIAVEGIVSQAMDEVRLERKYEQPNEGRGNAKSEARPDEKIEGESSRQIDSKVRTTSRHTNSEKEECEVDDEEIEAEQEESDDSDDGEDFVWEDRDVVAPETTLVNWTRRVKELEQKAQEQVEKLAGSGKKKPK